jgi:ZIP family zinc transporter
MKALMSEECSGAAIALGNAVDAVPEAIVLGIALQDRVVPLALVFAFSLGNLPDSGLLAAFGLVSYCS